MTRARDNADLGDSYGTLGSGVTFPSGTGASHGHVLQVVYGQYETQLAKTDTGFADLGLSASITPLSDTNKVLVSWTIQYHLSTNTSGFSVKLFRDDGGGYDLQYQSGSAYDVYGGTNTANERARGTWWHLDTPGVEVSTTYKIQVANYSTSLVNYQNAGNRSNIILMELVA